MMDISTSVTPGSVRAWQFAIRPASLLMAAGPVMLGAALAFLRSGVVDLLTASLAISAAMLMQVITNLQNDVGYTMRGAESTGKRIGLPRATALGWLAPRAVRRAILVLSVLATALGIGLVTVRGWPVLAIGGLSLLAALAYMGGRRPIAYTPYGELTVLVFFGPVAVLGTDWLLSGQMDLLAAAASLGVGSLAAAALAVNNHRDMAHDALVGRRTFAVVWGEGASRAFYTGLLMGPYLLVPLLAFAASMPWLLLPMLLVPTALALRRDFRRSPPGLGFNPILFRTFRLELAFAVALSIGAVLSRLTR
jgi:1,4-dihydroxy-2-naphthoate polyprenyltransferase